MMLSIILGILLLGILLTLWSSKPDRIARWTTSLFALSSFSLLAMWQTSSFKFVEYVSLFRIGGVDIAYHLGIDGLSYLLLLLTAVLGWVAVRIERAHKEPRAYFGIILGLLLSVTGVFVSLNLVLFFVFWEAVLVLMFLLILWWGHENRKYAAMRFLIYTGIGSGALLIALILLAVSAHSVTIPVLVGMHITGPLATAVFWLLLFAFFVKIPVVPFHTWLPDAHVQAPTAGSVLLAGVLLKMGGYGLLRLGVGILPQMIERYAPLLFVMGTLTLIYGAFLCLSQNNLKRLIAYSSVNHMGFVLLGVAAGGIGYAGAIFEMISHGLIAGLLFSLAGLVYERTGTFDLDKLEGLVHTLPKAAWLFVAASLAGLGLPGFSGFIAEFIVLYAVVSSFGFWAILPLFGVILTGAYFVHFLSRTVFGPSTATLDEQSMSMTPYVVLVVASLILGLLPFIVLRFLEAFL